MDKSFKRPYRPVDLNSSFTQSFSLVAMVEELMSEASFATSGRSSLTLARGDELTIVLVVLKSGNTLEEHSAPAAATVIALNGKMIFTTSADKITMEQGDSVTFTNDILHSVYADTDCAFLIVIGGKH